MIFDVHNTKRLNLFLLSFRYTDVRPSVCRIRFIVFAFFMRADAKTKLVRKERKGRSRLIRGALRLSNEIPAPRSPRAYLPFLARNDDSGVGYRPIASASRPPSLKK